MFFHVTFLHKMLAQPREAISDLRYMDIGLTFQTCMIFFRFWKRLAGHKKVPRGPRVENPNLRSQITSEVDLSETTID